MDRLKSGQMAPEFSLLDQEGKKVSLKDFAGQTILLYFYPKADTPGCTIQACSIRDQSAKLLARGIVAVGVSPDAPDAQRSFDLKYSLGFRLLSDPDHRVAEAFGTWAEKKRFGRTYHGILRSSFLIDERGMILGAWYNVKPAETVSHALAVRRAA